MWGDLPSLEQLESCLIVDPSDNKLPPVGQRMRAAYYLKQHYSTSKDNEKIQQEALRILQEALIDRRHGSLLRHELAYVLGQCRDRDAAPTLRQVLMESDDCLMVRHECAEALGAIGEDDKDNETRECLQECLKANRNVPELAETCLLALNVLDWRRNHNPDDDNGQGADFPAACACMLNPYQSTDPAPPHPSHASKSISELQELLCNNDLPLFDRYQVMFSLRNLRAATPLAVALQTDQSSFVFRHEVAYVLGQLQDVSTAPALISVVQNETEHVMVRHEAAEALGAIFSECYHENERLEQEISDCLHKYQEDPVQAVAESCVVALDAVAYWGGRQEDENVPNDDDGKPMTFGQAKQGSNSGPVLQQHFNVKVEGTET